MSVRKQDATMSSPPSTTTASPFKENYCAYVIVAPLDCNMAFDAAADFANHKAKFCIQSDYFDPVKLQQSLLHAETTTDATATSVLTFAQVQQYLNGSVESGGIGKVSLLDLKATMQKNELEMDKLRRHVKKTREKEKADELRVLKTKQQHALLQKQKEDAEVVALLQEIERRKEEELRARAQREKVKAELRYLDAAGMASLEEERKRELIDLVKQMELLKKKEAAAIEEIEALERRVKEQELKHRQDEKEVQAKLQEVEDTSKGDGRVKELRKRHMARSQSYGAQAALLEQKRTELQEAQKKIGREMEQLGRGDNQEDVHPATFNYKAEARRVEELAAQFDRDAKERVDTLAAMDTDGHEFVMPTTNMETRVEVDARGNNFASPSPTKASHTPRPEVSPEKPATAKTVSPIARASPKPLAPTMDSLEQEVLHRQQSDQALKRPATPRQPPPVPPPVAHYGHPPSTMPYADPMAYHNPSPMGPYYPPPSYGGYPPQPGLPPSSYYAPSPYGMPPPMMYPQQPPPYFNGYSGFAATGAAIMGYPPPMYMPFAPSPMMMPPGMLGGGSMFEPPPDPETIRLQQQLDAMKQLKEQRELEMETLRFQQMINSIQAKLPGVVAKEVAMMPSLSTASSATELAPTQKLPGENNELDSKELRQLKLKHAEDMLKLKQQRDLMEEEEKLQAIMEQREKRKKEVADQQAHEEWLANQKRLVMTQRMKKMIAQERPLSASGSGDTRVFPYDPELGFAIFWDYILLVPLQASFLQVTYAIYDGSILRTKHKVIRAHECEPHGPSFHRCILASKRDLDHMPASTTLRLLAEVAIVNPPSDKGPTKPMSLGWTAMDLFLDSDSLQQGNFKLPLSHSPLPQINATTKWSPPLDVSNTTDATLYLRVVHAAHVDEAAKFSVNPDATANKYETPIVPSVTTTPTMESPQKRKPSNAPGDGNNMRAQFPSSTSTSPLKRSPSKVQMSQPAKPPPTSADTNALPAIPTSRPAAIAVDNGPIEYVFVISQLRPTSSKEWNDVERVQLQLCRGNESNPFFTSDERDVDDPSLKWTACFSVHPGQDKIVTLVLRRKRGSGSDDTSLRAELSLDVGGNNQQVVDLVAADKDVRATLTVSLSPASTREAMDDSARRTGTPALPTQLHAGEGWVDCDLSSARAAAQKTLFAPCDGFDVYVDGARSLPDLVTATKLTCFALHADMSTCAPLQESTTAFASPDETVYSPMFNVWLEYRSERFNPTLTLLCRVDTIDATTKAPRVVGYCALPVFLTHGDDGVKPPTKATTQEFCLNAGAFQVPLRLGAQVGTDKIDLTAKACDGFLKLPCATLLVRIVPAAKTDDGLKCLSRADVPSTEWVAKGISQPTPMYAEKTYDSTTSRPSLAEAKLYKLRMRRAPNTVAGSVAALVDKAAIDTSEKWTQWLQSQLSSKPTSSVADTLSTVFPYEPEIGFRVAVDGLHNVQSGTLYKVVFCMSPPSPFYQDPKMTDEVHMTTSYDWSSAQSSPEFQDGFITFRDVMEFPKTQLTIIFDVRAMKQGKNNAWVSSQVGWGYLKLLNDARCVAAGSYQLPLFSGAVTLDILQHDLSLDELVASETTKKKGSLVSYLTGSSIFVRLEDNCLPNTFPQPLSPDVTPVGIAATPKYAYDRAAVATQKKKKPLVKLLGDKSERDGDKELNVAFAKEMDISHYSF
ncbi:Aste57867_11167 [Aphanomyces stellatus]|uniref:Aste57867_11167 protein n=1 Tax=Aphanomyces stellatus TaxID=120398 RepID=A0A485KTF6_9STRA|nr:hypothetical protein As57867_011125 [Aphanomyces stellatus]VFT88034.1 Aste57867_11167 [Aphanomyces stellatus]